MIGASLLADLTPLLLMNNKLLLIQPNPCCTVVPPATRFQLALSLCVCGAGAAAVLPRVRRHVLSHQDHRPQAPLVGCACWHCHRNCHCSLYCKCRLIRSFWISVYICTIKMWFHLFISSWRMPDWEIFNKGVSVPVYCKSPEYFFFNELILMIWEPEFKDVS